MRKFIKILVLSLALVAIPVLSPVVKPQSLSGKEVQMERAAEETIDYASRIEKVKQTDAIKLNPEDVISKDMYELLAENSEFKMYFYEPSLSIYLENKETGEILNSTLSNEDFDGLSNKTWQAYMKSGLVLTAIVNTDNTFQVDLFTKPHKKIVEKTENGFIADIYYPEYMFALTYELKLDDTGLIARVAADSIIEEAPNKFISTITMMPMLGYTYLDKEDGYMLIPDGNGALIYLDDKDGRYSTGFSQSVYGIDVGLDNRTASFELWDRFPTVKPGNKVIAPFFGMVHKDKEISYLGVIEEGKERAKIEAQPNGALIDYNRIFAKFLVRDTYVQPLDNSNSNTYIAVEEDRIQTDMQVRYLLSSGDSANYSGLANLYREYLLENKYLVQKLTDYKTRIDFLGADHEAWLLSTRSVPMTKISDISRIREELLDAGVENVLSIYKGWQRGGLYNLPIKKAKTENGLGSIKDLANLIEYYQDNDDTFYLYNDALRLNPAKSSAIFDITKRINKRTYVEEVSGEVYDEFRFITPSKISENIERLRATLEKNRIDSLAISGISNNLFSYSYNRIQYDRFSTSNAFEDIIKKLDDKVELVLEEPFDYLWKYSDAILDMPVNSSDYMYIDEDVPFLSMVLKGVMPMYSGYFNFEGNQEKFLLKLVETGVYPSFYITNEPSSLLINTNSAHLYSTEYENYKEQIIEIDKELQAVAKKTASSKIVKRESQGNLVTVTYDNGVEIILNYGQKEVESSLGPVKSMSYIVGEANE